MEALSQPPTALASWIQPVWTTLQELAIDPLPIFCEAGIDPKSVYDPLCRIPHCNVYKLWSLVLKHSADDGIALKVAKRITPATFYAVGVSAIASRSVYDLVKRILKYSQFMAEGVTFECHRLDDNLYRLRLQHNTDQFHPVSDETLFAAFFYVSKHYLNWELPAVKVSFGHEDRGAASEFSGFFNCMVSFNEDEYAIYFNKADVQRFPMTNPALASANDLIVDEQLARFNSEKQRSIVARIHEHIEQLFQDGRMSKDTMLAQQVAQHVHMSERNMQNQLQQQGTSYQKILDEWRAQKAKNFLLERRSVSDIAWLLGFNEVSSFSRAFKRWTGYSPSAYLSHS